MMTRNQILNSIRNLGKHQRYYSNLYKYLKENSDGAELLLEELEDQDFKDEVDLCMYLET